MTKKERWRWIAGYKHHYKVSTHGRVKSVDRIIIQYNASGGFSRVHRKGKILKAFEHTRNGKWDNHLAVRLCIKGKEEYRFVHHLVLETFIGPRPKGMEARHLDDVKANNHEDNLCWGAHSQNSRDAYKNGQLRDKVYAKGNTHYQAKLNTVKVAAARKAVHENPRKGIVAELAVKYNVSITTMSAAIRRKTWKHVT